MLGPILNLSMAFYLFISFLYNLHLFNLKCLRQGQLFMKWSNVSSSSPHNLPSNTEYIFTLFHCVLHVPGADWLSQRNKLAIFVYSFFFLNLKIASVFRALEQKQRPVRAQTIPHPVLVTATTCLLQLYIFRLGSCIAFVFLHYPSLSHSPV